MIDEASRRSGRRRWRKRGTGCRSGQGRNQRAAGCSDGEVVVVTQILDVVAGAIPLLKKVMRLRLASGRTAVGTLQ